MALRRACRRGPSRSRLLARPLVRLHRPLPYHTIPVAWYGMVDVYDGYLAAEASGSRWYGMVVWYGMVW